MGIGNRLRALLKGRAAPPTRPAVDLTADLPYAEYVREEVEHYAGVKVTENLREGGDQDTAAWHHYWARVGEEVHQSPYWPMAAFLEREYGQRGRPVRVLSLGSGYCGRELDLARELRVPHRIVCTDLNPGLFEEARFRARREGLQVEFRAADLNYLTLETQQYDIVLARAVLHHVVNLEHLFGQIAGSLAPGGVLHVVDVVGRNRRLLWEDSERFVNALLTALPDSVTGGHGVEVNECGGMEGVRQEVVLPLLREAFEPLYEHRHGAFMRFICTNPRLASRLNPGDPTRRPYLDLLIEIDDAAVRHGLLRPLELWGVYRPSSLHG